MGPVGPGLLQPLVEPGGADDVVPLPPERRAGDVPGDRIVVDHEDAPAGGHGRRDIHGTEGGVNDSGSEPLSIARLPERPEPGGGRATGGFEVGASEWPDPPEGAATSLDWRPASRVPEEMARGTTRGTMALAATVAAQLAPGPSIGSLSI